MLWGLFAAFFITCSIVVVPFSFTQIPADFPEIRCVVSKAAFSPRHEIEVDIGSIETGTEKRYRLLVTNPFPDDITFEESHTRGSDLKLLSGVSKIPANGTASFDIELNLSAKQRTSSSFRYISFFEGEGTDRRNTLSLRVKFEVTAFLDIPQKQAFIEVSDEHPIQEVKIPIIYSSPIREKDLTLSASSAIRDLPIKLESRGDRTWVTVQASLQDVANGGIGGKLFIESKKYAKSASTYISVDQKTDLKIFPKTGRFHTSSEDRAVANFVFELPKVPGQDAPRVVATIEGLAVQVDLKPQGDSGVFKATLSVRPDSMSKLVKENPELKIKWNVKTNGQELEAFSSLFFSTESRDAQFDERRYFSESVQAYGALLSSVGSGDVLIELKVNGEGSPKNSDDVLSSESVERWRIAFDHKLKRFLFIRHSTFSKELLLEAEGKIVSNGVDNAESIQGFAIRDGRITVRSLPNPVVELKKGTEPDSVFRDFAVPEFRGLGFCRTGQYESLEQVLNIMRMYQSPDSIVSATIADKTMNAVYNYTSASDSVDSFVDLTFDSENFVPLARKIQIKRNSQLSTVDREEYEWESVNGVLVPAVIRVWGKQVESANRQLFELNRDCVFRFRWFSVNEDVDEKIFDTDLSDVEQFRELTDPKLLEAEERGAGNL